MPGYKKHQMVWFRVSLCLAQLHLQEPAGTGQTRKCGPSGHTSFRSYTGQDSQGG